MPVNNHPSPSLARLVRQTLETGLGAVENRAELFMIEAHEERARVIQLVIRGVSGLILAMMALLMLTATILVVLPSEFRIYAAAGFTVVYLAGSAALFLSLKSLLKQTPFAESLSQLGKDRNLLLPSHD